MPLDDKWIVTWSYFFKMNGTRPNFSRRIGPQFSRDFLTARLFQVSMRYKKNPDLLIATFLPAAFSTLGLYQR